MRVALLVVALAVTSVATRAAAPAGPKRMVCGPEAVANVKLRVAGS